MVQINFAKGEVQCKIVYYGPACAGKTANLHAIHQQAPPHVRGALTTIATDTNRTLFFDFLPLNLGDVAGIRTKVQLYAVPYKENQNSLRLLVLQGVDGLVFVADSSRSHLENRNALTNLFENLRALGRDPQSIPLVFQWNKSDLANVHPAAEMNQALNPTGYPAFTACATTGMGVFPTLKAVTQQVLLNVAQAVAGRAAVDRVVPTPPQPLPEPASAPIPLVAPREPLPPLAEPEPRARERSARSPLDAMAPPFVAEPEPEPLPPLEPDPLPVPAPAMEFEEVPLPAEAVREAPFTPPWHLRQPDKPAVKPGIAETITETREFGQATASFDDDALPPLEPKPPPKRPPMPEKLPPPPPPPPPILEEAREVQEEAWQAEPEPWPIEEPPAPEEVSGWGDAPASHPSGRTQRVRTASAPYGVGWSAIDAHGRRRVTYDRSRDARPVVDRRLRPRVAKPQRSNELPLHNLITGSLVALACLIVTGVLVHTLL